MIVSVLQLLDEKGTRLHGVDTEVIAKTKKFYQACMNMSSTDVRGTTPLMKVNQPKSFIQSCFVRRASSLASSSVHTPPSLIVGHRNFIFGVNMPICP